MVRLISPGRSLNLQGKAIQLVCIIGVKLYLLLGTQWTTPLNGTTLCTTSMETLARLCYCSDLLGNSHCPTLWWVISRRTPTIQGGGSLTSCEHRIPAGILNVNVKIEWKMFYWMSVIDHTKKVFWKKEEMQKHINCLDHYTIMIYWNWLPLVTGFIFGI